MAKPEIRHETRDVPYRLPLYGLVSALVFVPLSLVAVWWLMETAWRARAPEPSPFAQASPRDPGPELQRDPIADLAALEERMQARLNGVGWIDRRADIVHIPIERAMELLVQRGLPPADGAEPPPPRAPARPDSP